jgi:hypothetical protein
LLFRHARLLNAEILKLPEKPHRVGRLEAMEESIENPDQNLLRLAPYPRGLFVWGGRGQSTTLPG